ncbi:Hsp70 family protein [Dactylosporangium matsuzakiense]|uniref:Hsp70 family protein n=1 Tax=Dactylosporangium matsuzakiense TaxID=53360 RepID=UPI0021C2B8F5|nr:Hsp70 family protein [Dactylosporangium matsuzakiense]UWZ47755.1 Hsp70 family protein [Dactylosporangium matsuzakiense]
MTAARLRLGVDFGTSTTIAMLQRPDARVQPLLFDGSPLLSSAVLLGPDGLLHTGRDAAHLARSAPERLEPNPKRRIDDTSVLLGDAEMGVRDLITAVLSRVAREAARVAGPVQDVVLTHPADWGQHRRAVLVEAARHAGFATIELVGEPTAAATYFAHTRGGALPVGAGVLVYDLGAGTCDVTLLRRNQTGFEQVASDGLNDVGGLDVDAAVVGFLQATYGELWTSPATRRQLWDDVRSAKEMLSRASGTVIGIPSLGREVPLGREQLEGLARPVLRSTISMTRAMLNESGIPQSAVAGLFLVGGSSRIPLVATMLHEALGIAPVVAEQPELVVAEGSLYVNRTPNTVTAMSAMSAPVSGPIPAPVSAVPSSGVPYPNTQAFSGSPIAPVSAPGYPAAPVSPPVAPMPMRPYPPAPAQAPAPPPRRGLSPLALVAIILAGVLVVAGGVFGAARFLGKADGQNTNANGTTGAGVTGAATNGGGGGAATGGPGKYDLTKVPDDECTKSDASTFFELFEAENGKPTPIRVPNATVNASSCSYGRTHAVTDPQQQRVATISFTIFGFADTQVAANAQNQEMETGKLAGPNTILSGFGEQAIIYETPQSGDLAKSSMQLTLAVRDSNARMTVYVNVNRSDSAGWSQQEKNTLRDKTVEAAKATFGKTLAGMKR